MRVHRYIGLVRDLLQQSLGLIVERLDRGIGAVLGLGLDFAVALLERARGVLGAELDILLLRLAAGGKRSEKGAAGKHGDSLSHRASRA